MKHPKTQDQCAEVLQARQGAIKAMIFNLQSKGAKGTYQGTESQRREAINLLRLEEMYLERAISAIYDDRPIDVVLETNYCKGCE
jgi:hypothetical protein